MKILVENLQGRIKANPPQVKNTAYKIINKLEIPPQFNNLSLSIYFVKNSIIKKLNKQFFNKDYLTDVISFNLGNDYAEIFIAPSVVKYNATSLSIEFREEFHRCIVHGILHIFGFTDIFKKEKTKMWKKQEALLAEIINE